MMTTSRRIATAMAAIAVVAGGIALAVLSDGFDGPTEASAQEAQATPVPVTDETGTFTPAEQAAILQMIEGYIDANPGFVRDYLMENPEVIRDAVTELERRRVANEAEAQADAIERNRDLLFQTGRHAILGNPEGDVTLVEFFDYNCTYCRRTLDDIERLINDDPGLRIILKEFPVLGTGSTEAAQVAAAVNMIAPEAYAEFHRLLLSSSAQATEALAIAAAVEAGVDEEAIRATMDTSEAIGYIDESYRLADALSINATPTFVIANEVVVGAVGYDALRGIISSVRECGETTC